MIGKSVTSFSKSEPVTISSQAWEDGIVYHKDNIIYGFDHIGLWILIFTHKFRHWRLYHLGGTGKADLASPTWIITWEVVRNEVLMLPTAMYRFAKMTTKMDVKNWLITRKQFNQYEA